MFDWPVASVIITALVTIMVALVQREKNARAAPTAKQPDLPKPWATAADFAALRTQVAGIAERLDRIERKLDNSHHLTPDT